MEAFRGEDWGEAAATSFDPFRHAIGFKADQRRDLLFSGGFNFLPTNWCRDGRVGLSAEGINIYGCLMGIVLAPIDQYFSFAQRLPHVGNNQIRSLSLQESAKARANVLDFS